MRIMPANIIFRLSGGWVVLDASPIFQRGKLNPEPAGGYGVFTPSAGG